MRNTFRFIFIFIAQGFAAAAQTAVTIPKVVPPSPDAAALGKYGSMPVSLHTGTPEINIPLYTIKTGRLELPITLSYHASGIRVNEKASWVGLGWTLNAGGAVMRTVVGKADNQGFWSYNNIRRESQLSSKDFVYAKNVADGVTDAESDYYFYNFTGHTGKFYYPQNDPTHPMLIPLAPLKLSSTPGGFRIVDETGTIYKFEAGESIQQPGETLIPYTAYYLTEIISVDGTDTIRLDYVSDGAYSQPTRIFSETIGQRCIGPGAPQIPNEHTFDGGLTHTRTIQPLRLATITFAHGKVAFVRDHSRIDLNSESSRLGEVWLFSRQADGSFPPTPIRKFVLDEDYFDAGSGPNADRYRLKLSGVTEIDALGNTVRSHRFHYNSNVTMPPLSSLSQDWWGFYNGKQNATLVQTETVNFAGYDFNVGAAGGNRVPSASHMRACMLTKIVYPTGGFTEFDFEPHAVTSGMAGGLRIKEIRDYASPSSVPMTRRYSYSGGEPLIPLEYLRNAQQRFGFLYFAGEPSPPCRCALVCQGERMTVKGESPLELSTFNGSTVVYAQVTVAQGPSGVPNGSEVFNFDVGADQFTPKNYPNEYIQENTGWRGGNLVGHTFYRGSDKVKEIANQYSMLATSEVTGTKIGWKKIKEGCSNPCMTDEFMYNLLYAFDYSVHSGIKKVVASSVRDYAQSTPANYLETRTDYAYENLNANHQQLSKRTTVDSKGNALTDRFWYPADFDPAAGNVATLLSANIIALPIREERQVNGKVASGRIIKPNNYGNPLEIYEFESGSPQPVAHDAATIVPTLSPFKKRAEIVYENTTNNVSRVRGNDDQQTSYVWGYNRTLPIAEVKSGGNLYSGELIFHTSFEDNGIVNLTARTGEKVWEGEFTVLLPPENGRYRLSYWRKDGSDPWALIQQTVIVTANVRSISIGRTGSVIDEVRLMPEGSMMTTYSYDPLKGVTSVTDANNITTYYQYDAFGRLARISDDKGNPLKAISYNYKQ